MMTGTNDRSFIVRADSRSGTVKWLAPTSNPAAYSLGERGEAETFATREAAEAAIAKMPKVFADSGIRFTIEPVR